MGGSGGGAALPAAPAGSRPEQQRRSNARGAPSTRSIVMQHLHCSTPHRMPVVAFFPVDARWLIMASQADARVPQEHAPPWRRTLRSRAAAKPHAARLPPPLQDEGLLPEEDAQIPGSYRDAMSSKTPLGKAVAGACDELDALGSLVRAHAWAVRSACGWACWCIGV